MLKRVVRNLGLVLVASLLAGCLSFYDAATHGPYARAFNQRCQRLADRAGLVGSPESDVVKVLGKPTSVWRYWSATDLAGRPVAGADFIATYNYAPCPFAPCGMFQVHCRSGIVEATEQLDD